MNKFIKEQLSKCVLAHIPEYDDNSTLILIPCGVKKRLELEIGKSYQIKIDSSLVVSGQWYETIHGNWNGGIGPNYEEMVVKVDRMIGKMVHISGNYVDNPGEWCGYIPSKNIKIIKEV